MPGMSGHSESVAVQTLAYMNSNNKKNPKQQRKKKKNPKPTKQKTPTKHFSHCIFMLAGTLNSRVVPLVNQQLTFITFQ